MIKTTSKALGILTLLPLSASAATVIVTPGNNNVPIDEVTFNDNGMTVVQSSSQPTTTNNQRGTPLTITNVRLTNGDNLDVFNFDGVRVELGNLGTSPGSSISGIGAFLPDGTNVPLNGPGGTAAFVSAAEAALQSSDLNSYIYYDSLSAQPPSGTIDYRVHMRFAFEPTDYLLVQERNGNTFFELTALDINGNPIPDANVLNFGGTNTTPHTVYDWNTGFASDTYQTNQEYAFTVAEVSLFFAGTTATPQPVYGFAIDNDGQADTKFFGLSDNTFRDNPFNPTIPGPDPIPEPSGPLSIGILLSLGFMVRNRR